MIFKFKFINSVVGRKRCGYNSKYNCKIFVIGVWGRFLYVVWGGGGGGGNFWIIAADIFSWEPIRMATKNLGLLIYSINILWVRYIHYPASKD
jgi:hypothetical protein